MSRLQGDAGWPVCSALKAVVRATAGGAAGHGNTLKVMDYETADAACRRVIASMPTAEVMDVYDYFGKSVAASAGASTGALQATAEALHDFESAADEMAGSLQHEVYVTKPGATLAPTADELEFAPGLPAATIPKLQYRTSRWRRWTSILIKARFTVAGEEEEASPNFSAASPPPAAAPSEAPSITGAPLTSGATPSTGTSATTPA